VADITSISLRYSRACRRPVELEVGSFIIVLAALRPAILPVDLRQAEQPHMPDLMLRGCQSNRVTRSLHLEHTPAQVLMSSLRTLHPLSSWPACPASVGNGKSVQPLR